ncbi:Fic family protein [Legionella worsleiensis]|uniref:Fic/DOC family protein n=1 Tax=Legionella worsleiensis TaxID=45076 RepID=A0A0W1A6R5_9GAMM|nr:Fic family protein [Legionella worsleiensis]KTD76996.1 Fic/DOC family protein [Legionella worsleiensis]STY33330.1 mobile mystery protein B [Legionella worsleiensis]
MKLKVFNPALIYGSEPEQSPRAMILGDNMTESMFTNGQYEDIYSAYRYAEEEVLPWIERNGLAALTPELFEQWILSIHQRMGKTLLTLCDDLRSGEYAKTINVICHYDAGMIQQLCLHMAGILKPKLSDAQFLQNLVSQNKELDIRDATIFLSILQRLAKDRTAPIHPALLSRVSAQLPFDDFNRALHRLATAWHENLLSADERRVVEKIVLFTAYPDHIPQNMRLFCETMLEQWKQLDGSNLEAVSAFCADLFYRFTHIHPFPNGNGRTAAELNNIVLRSIHLPDIMMRKPDDAKSISSSYSKAIACIEKDRRPLAAHIHQCITEAQTKPFSSPLLQRLIESRMAIHRVATEIKAIKPGYNLDRLPLIVQQKNPMLVFMDPSNKEHAIIACQLLLSVSTEVLTQLKKEAEIKPVTSSSAPSLFFAKPALDNLALKQGMEHLTGAKDWKINSKGDLSMWRYCASEAEAHQIVTGLKQLQCCDATVRTTSGEGKKIVLCTQLKVDHIINATQAQAACSY